MSTAVFPYSLSHLQTPENTVFTVLAFQYSHIHIPNLPQGERTMPTDYLQELRPFLNEQMQLSALPAKYKKQLVAFHYLATRIPEETQFSETEINNLLNNLTAFGDPATLRRELVEKQLLYRTKDCRVYQKAVSIPPLSEFLAKYV